MNLGVLFLFYLFIFWLGPSELWSGRTFTYMFFATVPRRLHEVVQCASPLGYWQNLGRIYWWSYSSQSLLIFVLFFLLFFFLVPLLLLKVLCLARPLETNTHTPKIVPFTLTNGDQCWTNPLHWISYAWWRKHHWKEAKMAKPTNMRGNVT